jgi:hypothetical protein
LLIRILVNIDTEHPNGKRPPGAVQTYSAPASGCANDSNILLLAARGTLLFDFYQRGGPNGFDELVVGVGREFGRKLQNGGGQVVGAEDIPVGGGPGRR